MKEQLLKPVFLFGASSLGVCTVSIIKQIKNYKPIGFIDDNLAIGELVCDVPVLGAIDDLPSIALAHRVNNGIISIGNNYNRMMVYKRILEVSKDFAFPNIVCRNAYISENVSIGKGVVIFPGTVVSPECSIGDFTIINANSTLGTRTTINKFVNICPGVNIGSECSIGQNVFVGIGSNITQRLTISDFSTIGAGSLVLNNVDKNEKVFGVPAKISSIRKK